MNTNNQKGFIVPLVIGIIAILIIGGGVYVYKKDSNCSGLDDMARALCLAHNRGETLGIDFGDRPDLKQETASTSATNVADITKDWETYTNDQYGFSFQYPSFLMVKSYPKLTVPAGGGHVVVETININDENHVYSGANIISNKNKLSLENLITEAFGQNLSKIYGREAINGEVAIKFESSNGSAVHYAFSGLDFVVAFHIYKSEKDPGIFNQILSTFKFTN